MNSEIAAAKQALRNDMRHIITAVGTEAMIEASAKLCEHLQQELQKLPTGAAVALFGGIPGEPDLLPLIDWLISRQCRPVVFGFADGQLQPQQVSSAKELGRGPFGVWVPPPHLPVLRPEELSVILVPGLAFDHSGRRLGRGRGYFDKFLSLPGTRARLLGVCLDCQLVPSVPTEPHDVLIHTLITESGRIDILPTA